MARGSINAAIAAGASAFQADDASSILAARSYGFRNFDEKWVCVAASDEQKHGRILDKRLVPNK